MGKIIEKVISEKKIKEGIILESSMSLEGMNTPPSTPPPTPLSTPPPSDDDSEYEQADHQTAESLPQPLMRLTRCANISASKIAFRAVQDSQNSTQEEWKQELDAILATSSTRAHTTYANYTHEEFEQALDAMLDAPSTRSHTTPHSRRPCVHCATPTRLSEVYTGGAVGGAVSPSTTV